MTYENQLKLKLKQETAHEMDLALSTFHNMLEPLEEFIGKAGYYSNWDSKRQLYRNTIADSNDTLGGFEDLFLTQLLIVTGAIGKKPADFRKKIQEEYYKWINATGIDVKDCPDKLKHFLFEINEVLEGRGEKIFNQTKELMKGIKLDPKDMPGIFGATHGQLNRNSERKKALKGQKWNELEEESKFIGGDNEKGGQAFGRIASSVASSHNDFNFYQKNQQKRNPNYRPLTDDPSEEFLSSSSPAGSSNQSNTQEVRWNLIIDIGNNKNDWEIKPVVAYHNYISGRWYQGQSEQMLIHRTVKIEYNQANGDLIIQPSKMYKLKDFNDRERAEINQIFGNPQIAPFASADNQKTSFYQSKIAERELSYNQPQEDNNNISTSGILAIIGAVSVLTVSSVIVVKKHLKKAKK